MNANAEKILALIEQAGAITIDDSPMLFGMDIAEDARTSDDMENQVARASWDSEGLQYDVIFTLEAMSNAKIEPGKILIDDHEGYETTLNLFKLTSLV